LTAGTMNDRKGQAARLNHSANVGFLAQAPTHPIGQVLP
jgi:hypothetical protein